MVNTRESYIKGIISLEHAIRKVQEKQEGLNLEALYQIFVLLKAENLNTQKNNAEILLRSRKNWCRSKYR